MTNVIVRKMHSKILTELSIFIFKILLTGRLVGFFIFSYFLIALLGLIYNIFFQIRQNIDFLFKIHL
mgnify:CR=1 FL=1